MGRTIESADVVTQRSGQAEVGFGPLHQFSMRSSQNKPELKGIKSRNAQEEGDHGVFRSPQQRRK